MKFVKKKVLKIMSNGASMKNAINSTFKSKRLCFFYEKDLNNTILYLKVKNISIHSTMAENTQYRKKYLN